MKLTKPASAVLLSGLGVRLGLAPFTGHPGDMALFVESQRLYYQTGAIDLRYFPTLPALYYVQLLFYAPYQLLRLVGMPDFQFLYHDTLMLEGLFLKLPLILCDAGIFIIILRFTRKLLPSTLFFLNPFPIYLSAVWGTYDSLMLFPLVLGVYILAKGGSRVVSSAVFVVSGLMKLFGFVAFALVVCNSIVRRRFRDELPLEILCGLTVVALTVAPVFLLGGFESFLYGIVYRFIGLGYGTAGGASYNVFETIFKINPSGNLPILPVALGLICVGYSYEFSKAKAAHPSLILKWTLIGALVFSLFSASEPQWLSWLVPLGILYGSLTGRAGLQYFAYIFGVFVTFLTMTLLQGTAYMLVGSGAGFILGYVENVPGAALLYTLMTTIMIAMFCGYSFSKKLKSFRLEVVPLTILLYLQLYFWIVVVGVGKFVGVY